MFKACTYRKQFVALCSSLLSFLFLIGQTNEIKQENALPGNPSSEWDLGAGNAGSLSLQGFATDISVNRGTTVHFKINASSAFTYTIKIYRLGYYGGNGARLITTLINPQTNNNNYTGIIQPQPLSDAATGLVDCGNWTESASWDVPSTAVSGVYIAKLTNTSNSNITSHIVFIVRDDASHSDLFFQTSDATWQAYNNYGGNSLYEGGPLNGHASKVSYNRPFLTRNGGTAQDWLFSGEYPMIRFLERNGYDVTYTTNVDAARNGSLIQNHRVYLSVGHDEYWSAEQRSSVEAARNNGVNLCFFSGNEIYWKTRWENSIDASNTSYRTLVCYKEGTLGELSCGGKCDPTNIWTGLWRDGCSNPGTGGCQPENALSGDISWGLVTTSYKVPSTYKNLRLWRNTSIASLANGSQYVFPNGTLGYEISYEQYFNSYPEGRFTLSSTPVVINGNNEVNKLSLYRHSSNALVFAAGSAQISWGVDNYHDYGSSSTADINMQQAIVNLLADMNTQPTSLMSGLVAATASTDITKPTSTITSPANGSSFNKGTLINLSGTASDAGGGVIAGVEISLDGGTTWKAATGTSSWTYAWTPTVSGNYVIKVRGIDDSGNIGVAGTAPSSNAINVTINGTMAYVSTSPTDYQTNIGLNGPVKAIFDQSVNASTVTGSTFQLRDANNNIIPATLSTSTNQITLTPSSPLIYSGTYTATVKGGVTGIQSTTGNTVAKDSSWSFTVVDPTPLAPTEGPGGPILVISTSTNPFSRYAVEILRAEGLNEFNALDISAVDASVLNNYDVVILGEMTVTSPQVTMLTNWVNAGGTLIAFRPSSLLNTLFGISSASGTLVDKYLLVNTASGPGTGIVNQTIQFHGTADLHTLSGATSLATLYSAASTATTNPAVTTINVGSNGGKAIAFTYDLAKSIIYTRQGNPAWAGQERDGQTPIRSDDLFFGSPNWIDFNKIAIPQADEQQRLLANIILQSNLHRKPLPRFWYFPKGVKAAIIMTGDDHANNGTAGRFDQFLTLGPNSPKDVADWNAVRMTSYLYARDPGPPVKVNTLTNQQVINYQAQGFELSIHPQNGCEDFTSTANLTSNFTSTWSDLSTLLPAISQPVTNRFHCLVWSDWATMAKVEVQQGIRFDVNYYYWPQSWMSNTPGMFTGSGMPMRFADLDGSLIDCYQAPTQMTDETNMNYTTFCNALLDKAIGPEGYYGAFTTNMHTDGAFHAGSDAIVASAKARQIPIVSSKQMLTWVDGRNNSSFGSINWAGNQLSFTITARSGARNMKAMLPLFSATDQLTSLTRNGVSVTLPSPQTIKGIQYIFFDATTGTYVATYGAVTTGTINGTVTLQGRPAPPNAQWSVPVQVELYVSGNSTPVATYNTPTNSSGQFTIAGVPTGTYNIKIKNSHTLARVKTAQTIVAGTNNIDFGTLLEGDVNDDNYVTLQDFSFLIGNLNKIVGDPGVNANADLNNDGFITLADISTAIPNFNKTGDFNP